MLEVKKEQRRAMDGGASPSRPWGNSAVFSLNILPSYKSQDEGCGPPPSTFTQTKTFETLDANVGTRKTKSKDTQVKFIEPDLSPDRSKNQDDLDLNSCADHDMILSVLTRAYNLLLSTEEERSSITAFLSEKRQRQSFETCSNCYSLEGSPHLGGMSTEEVDLSPIYCYYCYGKLLIFGKNFNLLPSFWPSGASTIGKVIALKTSSILPFNNINYVTAVSPYPSLSNKLAVGTVKGTVAVITVNFSTHTFEVIHASNHEVTHASEIIFIQWFNAGQITGLITAGKDGRILIWELVRSEQANGHALMPYSGVAFTVKSKNVTVGTNLSKAQISKMMSFVELLQGAKMPNTLELIIAFSNGTVQEISFYLKPASPPKFYSDLVDVHNTGLKVLRQYNLMPGTRVVRTLPHSLLKSVTNKAQLIHLSACRLILQSDGSLIMSEIHPSTMIYRCAFKSSGAPLTHFISLDKTLIAIDSNGSILVYSLYAGDIVVSPSVFISYSVPSPDWTITLCSYQIERSAIVLAKCRKEVRVIEVPLISSILTDERCMAQLYARLFSS